MKSSHFLVSLEDFQRMAWDPGWKYEYFDGQGHVTPQEHVICTVLPIVPRPTRSPLPLRRPVEADAPSLIAAFLAAFGDGIELCDHTPAQARALAEQSVQGYFAGRRGEPLSASRVATEASESDAVAGASLITASAQGTATLELLFVADAHRRRGLATAMVAAGLGELASLGFTRLESGYYWGNRAGEAWQRRFGFVEEEDLHTTRLRLRLARHEIERRAHKGPEPGDPSAGLEAEERSLRAAVARLEARAEQEGYEAVSPLLRRARRP